MHFIDLSKLLNYYEKLNEAINWIYPDEITWENVNEFNFDLDYKHPIWVQLHFPLLILYHREKAGKLRSSKNLSIMYQNNFNVLSQVVWTADEFGAYHRKNKHKGFSNIVAAIPAKLSDYTENFDDNQKPKKFKNFSEFFTLYDVNNIHVKALCEILDENYSSDSTGQLRLI